jgi:hypothetical protein
MDGMKKKTNPVIRYKTYIIKLGRNSRHVIIMKIEIGKTYHNKTLKFLLPGLKLLGTDFRAKLNSVHSLALEFTIPL